MLSFRSAWMRWVAPTCLVISLPVWAGCGSADDDDSTLSDDTTQVGDDDTTGDDDSTDGTGDDDTEEGDDDATRPDVTPPTPPPAELDALDVKNAYSIVPGMAFSWKTFNLRAGLGYGNFNVGGVNFVFPRKTLVPELDLYWRW